MIPVTIALVGQPNVGKSQLINALSGARLKVGNYAGVTVEVAEADFYHEGRAFRIIDLPGAYSLDTFGRDEQVTRDYLLNGKYDLILNVVDSTHLERNLYLTSELMELKRKMVIALNMTDEAEKENINIDSEYLTELLAVPSTRVSARHNTGLDSLLSTIMDAADSQYVPSKMHYSDTVESAADEICEFISQKGQSYAQGNCRELALGLLRQDREVFKRMHDEPIWVELQPILNKHLDILYTEYETKDNQEIFTIERQAFARGASMEAIRTTDVVSKDTSAKIDSVLLNRFLGIPIFLFLMWGLFQMTFELGVIPMDWIDAGFAAMGDGIGDHIENEAMRSLLVDGILAGVGAVMLFLPNIIILFLGIALLETTGYMSRVAFLLDGFFHRFGLHGKSFIPLVTGFGCSVPAYMAARTLKNEKDRLITMFITGFMSCGAKLPVYVLFAGAFFSESMAGNAIFVIYIFGVILGLIGAKILRSFVFKGEDEPFVMEIPKYRLPSFKLVWYTVWSKAVMYLKKAATFILAASILIWFITAYPKNEQIDERYAPLIEQAASEEAASALESRRALEKMEQSYLGTLGKTIEPLFAPLGFDWRMSVATVSGLAAKEVIVSTLGVLYALGEEEDEGSVSLRERIRENISFPSAIAFIVFVVVYLPCLAATAVFAREAGNIRYVAYLVLFTFGTAWVLSWLAYLLTLAIVA